VKKVRILKHISVKQIYRKEEPYTFYRRAIGEEQKKMNALRTIIRRAKKQKKSPNLPPVYVSPYKRPKTINIGDSFKAKRITLKPPSQRAKMLKYSLSDGHHRLTAAQAEGRKRILAAIFSKAKRYQKFANKQRVHRVYRKKK